MDLKGNVTWNGDGPHSGREEPFSFVPRPTMHTYLALPPRRTDDELPCTCSACCN